MRSVIEPLALTCIAACLLAGQVQAVGAGVGTVHHITTFRQALMQVFGSFKLVLNDKDSHGVLPFKEWGYSIRQKAKLLLSWAADGC